MIFPPVGEAPRWEWGRGEKNRFVSEFCFEEAQGGGLRASGESICEPTKTEHIGESHPLEKVRGKMRRCLSFGPKGTMSRANPMHIVCFSMDTFFLTSVQTLSPGGGAIRIGIAERTEPASSFLSKLLLFPRRTRCNKRAQFFPFFPSPQRALIRRPRFSARSLN